MVIHYLNSGVSKEKHELIQVVDPANVTIHKIQRRIWKRISNDDILFNSKHHSVMLCIILSFDANHSQGDQMLV